MVIPFSFLQLNYSNQKYKADNKSLLFLLMVLFSILLFFPLFRYLLYATQKPNEFPELHHALDPPKANISADSTELREPGGTIYVLTKKAPFGERADNFCQVIEEVEGHKFLLVKGNGIHSAPSVTHLPSCWCFRDSVK